MPRQRWRGVPGRGGCLAHSPGHRGGCVGTPGSCGWGGARNVPLGSGERMWSAHDPLADRKAGVGSPERAAAQPSGSYVAALQGLSGC